MLKAVIKATKLKDLDDGEASIKSDEFSLDIRCEAHKDIELCREILT